MVLMVDLRKRARDTLKLVRIQIWIEEIITTFLNGKINMIFMKDWRKSKRARDNMNLVWIQIWFKELWTFLIGKVDIIRLTPSPTMTAPLILLRKIKEQGGFQCKLAILSEKIGILRG